MRDRQKFAPAIVLALGGVLLLSVQAQRSMALQAPLAEVAHPIDGYATRDLKISDAEQEVGGFTSYLNRVYFDSLPDGTEREVYGVFVGFFDSQQQGKTIHSPKNCLPGGGWEPMSSSRIELMTPAGPAPINRYVIANNNTKQQALVYYWYQGRGRVAANEYLVKLDLLRDAALRRRTDEALVRLVIPVTPEMSEAQADDLARRVANRLIPTLYQHLPAA
jgi:EpsI family protein